MTGKSNVGQHIVLANQMESFTTGICLDRESFQMGEKLKGADREGCAISSTADGQYQNGCGKSKTKLDSYWPNKLDDMHRNYLLIFKVREHVQKHHFFSCLLFFTSYIDEATI